MPRRFAGLFQWPRAPAVLPSGLRLLLGLFHVFDELLDLAGKEAAEPVNHISLDVRTMVVSQFGECHPVQARCFRNFLDSHAPPLPEFQVGDAFLELES